jgi:DNA mismatch endonuclease (patch repair protein)
MDTLTPEKRSRLMGKIRDKDTKPEWIVRRLVHSMGFRFRLHRKDLPGGPDLVFPAMSKVIFVHGCFWHRHRCRLTTTPKTNVRFWNTKFSENVLRDKKNIRRLKRAGWAVLVIWECQTRNAAFLEKRLAEFLEK